MRAASAPRRFLPRGEVDGAGVGREHDELREGQPGAIRDVGGRGERGGAIARQPEDERAEDMHAVITKRAQALDQRLADVVEAFVHVLEPFRRDGLDAHQGALDVRPPHGGRGTRDLRRPPS